MPNLSELLYYTGETSTQLIVWSLFIGVIAAALAGYFIKTKFGTFIRKLLENEIDSPEKAVTLDELGLKKKFFIKLGLKSHTNYKNMLVAITEEGKFFANNAYTAEKPVFKEFVVVKRKRSAEIIKETKTENEDVPLSGLARILQTKDKANADKAATAFAAAKKDTAKTDESEAQVLDNIKAAEIDTTENRLASEVYKGTSSKEANGTRFSDIPKERVKFDVTKAKYYIPPEIHDRAYSLYHTKSGKSNTFIWIVILLIVLGLTVTFSGELISGFTDLLSGIKNPFERPTI